MFWKILNINWETTIDLFLHLLSPETGTELRPLQEDQNDVMVT